MTAQQRNLDERATTLTGGPSDADRQITTDMDPLLLLVSPSIPTSDTVSSWRVTSEWLSLQATQNRGGQN